MSTKGEQDIMAEERELILKLGAMITDRIPQKLGIKLGWIFRIRRG